MQGVAHSYKNKTTSVASSVSNSVSDVQTTDSRKRQSKRDDAIRRKIESDLSKKKRGGARASRGKKGIPGTVLALNPSDAVLCKPNTTVYEAAQLMTARRENCILVVDDIGELLGIFTAKDLAFRIVGAGLDASAVTIDEIMTPGPMCTNANGPASEALTLMVQRGFRHLPVLDDNNQIIGVLDITKCYAQQMEKLERMHASSKKLYEALDVVHSEMGSHQPNHVFQYFENLKNKMNGPTLSSVLDAQTVPIYTNVKSSVYDATVLMKENNTTAVLVKDKDEEVAGIFTSKDVVLRVIAAGLDPKKCSVVRVMTPQPDVASDEVSIQAALRKMFEGHYLNLPVINSELEIIGIVDVLLLTYSTLNQIKMIESENANELKLGQSGLEGTGENEGPAWNKFWTSLDNDTDSAHSDSVIAAPDVTASEFNAFSVDNIKPSDSISYINAPNGDTPTKRRLVKQKSSAFFISGATFTFKFKSPAIGGRVHRIALVPDAGIEKLRQLIDEKLTTKDIEALEGETYAISYVDDEGDIVSITSDHDLIECVKIYRALDYDKVDLYIHIAHQRPLIEENKQNLNKTNNINNDIINGISNQVLISGVLGALSAAAIIGYIMGRK